uniref:Uncharacterized protein n=1 Tax=Rhizophora mucronata TaxID=61149 RepID=A0A2P2NU31_RHIMU
MYTFKGRTHLHLHIHEILFHQTPYPSMTQLRQLMPRFHIMLNIYFILSRKIQVRESKEQLFD